MYLILKNYKTELHVLNTLLFCIIINYQITIQVNTQYNFLCMLYGV